MMNSTADHKPPAPQFNSSSSLWRENCDEPGSRPPLPSLPSRVGEIFGEPGKPSVALGIERACLERDAAKETANNKTTNSRQPTTTKNSKEKNSEQQNKQQT
jgi:hypothetical protein